MERATDEEVLLSDRGDPDRANSALPVRMKRLCVFVLIAALLVGVITTAIVLSMPTASSRNTQDTKDLVYGPDGGIILFGDSLIGRSSDKYALQSSLVSSTPQYRLGIVNQGVGGDTSRKLLDRVDRDVVSLVRRHLLDANNTSPTLVIIVWDSDICDFTEGWNYLDVRSRYRSNVETFVRAILSSGASVALGGPMLCKDRLEYKETELDVYSGINREVCTALAVPYMDLRSAFIAAERAGQRVTDDGEHPSLLGTGILVDFFARAVVDWQVRAGNNGSVSMGYL